MELAGTDMIMGNIQDGLAPVGPLQLNKCLPLLVHAASLMDCLTSAILKAQISNALMIRVEDPPLTSEVGRIKRHDPPTRTSCVGLAFMLFD